MPTKAPSAKKTFLRAYRETLETERRAIDKMAEPEPNIDAPKGSPEHKAALLKMIDPDLQSSTTGTTNYYPYSCPRPSLYLVRKAFGYFVPDSALEPEIAAFLTETLLPMAGIKPTDDSSTQAVLTAGSKKTMCSDAETYFSDAIQQVKSGQMRGQEVVTAFHDASGQPLALQKNQQVSSALTLVPLAVDGLVLPVGTIVGIDDRNVARERGRILGNFTVSANEVDEPIVVNPLRLSAWAYQDEDDRAMFATYNYANSYKKDRGDMLRSTTIDDFRQAAEQIMAICEVK